MVAATCGKGGNCVIKHFLPFISEAPKSEHASGFFTSFMYCYYLMFKDVILIKPKTSSPNSGEFYCVGLGFLGCSNELLEKKLKVQKDFKVNHTLFTQEEIPESFTNQLFSFITDLMRLNTSQKELQNILLLCKNPDIKELQENTKCLTYLNPKFLATHQSKRYRQWIRENRFQ